jgi:hypothetical protein
MTLHSFIIEDEHFPDLKGYLVDVQYMSSLFDKFDVPELEMWSTRIVDDFVRGECGKEELRAESVDIRIWSPEKVLLLDTITRK